MFSKLTRNHPVESKKIKPDETFLTWLHQMRNPTSTDSANHDIVKSDPTTAHPSTREAA